MSVKEEVGSSYIEDWHERTKDYVYPDKRRAVVIGSDYEKNIGAVIANTLAKAGFIITEFNVNSFDLTVDRQVETFNWDRFDTVIFANGQTNLDWIENQKLGDIEEVIQNKLIASIKGTQGFVRKTIGIPYKKSIVYIGSMAAGSVLNGSAPYCASCAGLNHFARCVAWELAPKGYQVFVVNPSNVEGTPMTEATIEGLMKYRDLDRDAAEQYWGAVRALPRWLKAENIGEVIKWLVTDKSSEWLSGVPLNLGGGLR